MKSAKQTQRKKPAKPYRDFPLFLHATGQWAKKVRGKVHYFGVDSEAALNKWLAERDDLMAGRTPRLHPQSGPTIRDIVNRFLSAKKSLMGTGELSPSTWRSYFMACELVIEHFGKERLTTDLLPSDFEAFKNALAKTRGAVALGSVIQRIRTLFKFAWDEGIIDKPIRFGSVFKKPSRKTMRKARIETGSRMLEAADLRKLLKAAGPPMKAMILLGLNCGFGNSDVASLPASALDLADGWANFPRPKTAINRRCPLWPETVEAIREAIAARPTPKIPEDAGLVFVTKYGKRWVRVREREDKPAVPIDSVRLEFDKLLAALGLKRRGIGFYALRHIFRTVADSAKDQPAIDRIMGHADESMADLYRERVDDARLKAVTDVVHGWLFPPGTGELI